MKRPVAPSEGVQRALGCAVVLIALIGFKSQAISQDTDIGRTNFVTYCAECHGIDGRGTGPRGAALSTKPADLTILAKKNKGKFDPGAIFQIIDGRRPEARAHLSQEMPIWGCRHQDAPLPRRRISKHQPYFRPAVTHSRDESVTVESFVDMACDSPTIIQDRILSIVSYLSRIQR